MTRLPTKKQGLFIKAFKITLGILLAYILVVSIGGVGIFLSVPG